MSGAWCAAADGWHSNCQTILCSSMQRHTFKTVVHALSAARLVQCWVGGAVAGARRSAAGDCQPSEDRVSHHSRTHVQAGEMFSTAHDLQCLTCGGGWHCQSRARQHHRRQSTPKTSKSHSNTNVPRCKRTCGGGWNGAAAPIAIATCGGTIAGRMASPPGRSAADLPHRMLTRPPRSSSLPARPVQAASAAARVANSTNAHCLASTCVWWEPGAVTSELCARAVLKMLFRSSAGGLAGGAGCAPTDAHCLASSFCCLWQGQRGV